MSCVGTKIMETFIALPSKCMQVLAEQTHLTSPHKNKISSYAKGGYPAPNPHSSSPF